MSTENEIMEALLIKVTTQTLECLKNLNHLYPKGVELVDFCIQAQVDDSGEYVNFGVSGTIKDRRPKFQCFLHGGSRNGCGFCNAPWHGHSLPRRDDVYHACDFQTSLRHLESVDQQMFAALDSFRLFPYNKQIRDAAVGIYLIAA
jgi:hypothetical protein